jgi:hypothetical protein
MKRTWRILSATFLALLAGCAPAWPYSSMASHTLRSGPDKDTDVVWVQHIDGKFFR